MSRVHVCFWFVFVVVAVLFRFGLTGVVFMGVKVAGLGLCAPQVAHRVPTSNQVPLFIVASVHIDGRVEQVCSTPAPMEIYTGNRCPDGIGGT